LVEGRYFVTERRVVVWKRCVVVEREERKALMAA